MSETKYQVGDRVQFTAGHACVGSANEVLTIKSIDTRDSSSAYRFLERTGVCTYPDNHFVPVSDLDHLQVGDVLIDDDGRDREVFAILGTLVAVHDGFNDGGMDSDWYHADRLRSLGWKLKDQPADDPVELTLEDVAKLKGVPVSQIKIVEK